MLVLTLTTNNNKELPTTIANNKELPTTIAYCWRQLPTITITNSPLERVNVNNNINKLGFDASSLACQDLQVYSKK